VGALITALAIIFCVIVILAMLAVFWDRRGSQKT
jgi:hypothetical protein